MKLEKSNPVHGLEMITLNWYPFNVDGTLFNTSGFEVAFVTIPGANDVVVSVCQRAAAFGRYSQIYDMSEPVVPTEIEAVPAQFTLTLAG
jgi:hypothetical protein